MQATTTPHAIPWPLGCSPATVAASRRWWRWGGMG